ncbi:aminomethyltransferase family protein [Pseudomonas aeruginosa]|uniref:aminomethyl transferase family protein n=1 Tax=Pseudomonas aeruginosa TaxID=287 RepID=UPI0007A9C306|nr:aminomethyl transferase family protein [Pseudomonas aeruginosa]SAJ30146.1 Aminomethyltransferase [Enterobacter cloacae]ELK4788219.1 aminomethyltransferase family protein [Pseudomonas aeruginosa]MBG6790984.1 aminomethyl transferase family protein [Pseudomonas aeruginosa]MBG6799185.1 aminomethyl transferase family protein [Pseudomonas aeruginosa]MEA8709984.1 aminomethyl transferase family protein [Pseudomonas aeruginosa]
MLPKNFRKTPEGYFTSRWGHPEYSDWLDESMSWKDNCYIGDWSFLWQRRYRGPDVLKLFSDTSINSFANFAIMQSKHVTHCNRDGKVIHEGILSRWGEDEYMLYGRGGFLMDFHLRKGNYNVTSEAVEGFNFQVAGPHAAALMEKLTGLVLRDVKFMHSQVVNIAGHEVYALRQGMSGEPGVELQGPAEHAAEVYAAVLEAGQAFDIRKLGGRAAFINHLEACFPTIVTDYLPAIFSEDMAEYRAEFEAGLPAFASTFNVAGSFEADDISAWYRSPVELGWGRNIKFDHDFIGREALEREVANPRRVIRTLVWNADDVLKVFASLFQKGEHYAFMEMPRDQRGFMYADKVLVNGREVGVSTSRGYSYFFREMLSLCTLDVAHSEVGSEVSVIWGNPGEPQLAIRATVQPAPYKTDNRRN